MGRAAENLMNAIQLAVLQEKHGGGDYHGILIFLPDEVWWVMRDEENE
ncbi:hypothetical protein [Aciduliprofundum sp. MAR08-339]